ncbi:hypothetical protein AVEN_99708-1 [Araneus ventricosus]|uniref:Chromo domain-containing protein n=1 Tax=Araneus ventricosus TaxID=182803 RepID=A0A4Y2QNH2_ARAVE|nr:hypothetical protein AVEN_99708-1 [Araneus ventricosus]
MQAVVDSGYYPVEKVIKKRKIKGKMEYFVKFLGYPDESQGRWEVGLAEIIYPHTWYNVNEKDNIFGFDLGDGKLITRKIPPGSFETFPDILKAMVPYDFKHFDMNFIGVYVDGQSLPHNPLELNFDKNNYIKGYYSLFSGTDKFGQDQGLFISREEYINGNTLFAFNLSPDLCDEEHLNLIKHSNLRLEIKFTKALPQTICVLIDAEFDNVIEINKTRNILYDFGN